MSNGGAGGSLNGPSRLGASQNTDTGGECVAVPIATFRRVQDLLRATGLGLHGTPWAQSEIRKLEAELNSAPPAPSGSSAPADPKIEISDELRAKLKASLEENARLGPSVIPPDAKWTYHAMKGKAVIACRTHDTVGRRLTNFIELNVSAGLDGVALAEQIAQRLTEPSAIPRPALEALRDQWKHELATLQMIRKALPTLFNSSHAAMMLEEIIERHAGELDALLQAGATKG